MGDVDFLVGVSVDAIHYSAPSKLRIVFELGDRVEPALYVDVGDSVFFEADDRAHQIDPIDPTSVGPVLGVVGKQVERADTDGGALSLAFADGSRIQCKPHEDYEAWQVVGGSPQHLVVCMPGGEVAVWEHG